MHSSSRRLYPVLLRIRITGPTYERLRAAAAAEDISVSALVRSLLHSVGAQPGEPGSAPGAQLAAVVSAEHTRLLIELLLPDGERRSRALRERAADAAAQRVAEVGRALAWQERS